MQAAATLRSVREFEMLNKNPPPGVVLEAKTPATEWIAHVAGPADTPYQKGTFDLEIKFDNYPFKPPRVLFKTSIFHPNVSDKGEICADIYEKDWAPTKKMQDVFNIIRTMLLSPNLETPLNEEAGKLCRESKDEFFKRASEHTAKNALK